MLEKKIETITEEVLETESSFKSAETNPKSLKVIKRKIIQKELKQVEKNLDRNEKFSSIIENTRKNSTLNSGKNFSRLESTEIAKDHNQNYFLGKNSDESPKFKSSHTHTDTHKNNCLQLKSYPSIDEEIRRRYLQYIRLENLQR